MPIACLYMGWLRRTEALLNYICRHDLLVVGFEVAKPLSFLHPSELQAGGWVSLVHGKSESPFFIPERGLLMKQITPANLV